MKESITKFDLEAAFKALDAIDIPAINGGINANKPALTEIFSRKSKLDTLIEEYYDIGNTDELTDAKEAREAEVAKAKLARIEKIVDLDAETPEDLLTSYVGKFIIQCPQCMTLFYKNPEDIEESEEDTGTVNVNEVCQHCGNDSGYTLIGKVGEATAEETAELTDNSIDTESEEESEEESEKDESENEENNAEDENTEDETEEDAELDDLEALDLNIEDDEETNESLKQNHAESASLTEDVELETSPEDFEKLIKSSEFKKPISDNEARTMINEFEESVSIPSDEEEATADDLLTEGSLKDLGKALINRHKENKQSKKGGISAAIDKLTEKIKTRADKANWLLNNSCEDYDKAKLNKKGELVLDEQSRKYKVFVVWGFTDRYNNKKPITSPVSPNNLTDLVLGMAQPIVKDNYADADNIAKGWSIQQGNGPAFICMAKDRTGKKAAFLCEYFNGELEEDKLQTYYDALKKDIEGATLIQQSNPDNVREIRASKVEKDMEIVLDDDRAEVLEIGKSRFGSDNVAIKVKFTDGAIETFNISADTKIKVIDAVFFTLESFDAIPEDINALVENLEDLQEASLENAISSSLIQTSNDIAGFKLTDCEYLNEALIIKGKTYLTSGRTKDISYSFTEAFKLGDKIKLTGLTADKTNTNFELFGKVDNKNKVFITEAFNYLNR